MQVQSLGWEDSLELEMATYSSIFAGRILGTEEPGSPWSHNGLDMTEHTRTSLLYHQKIIGKLFKVPWGKMLAISYLGTACIPKLFS